MGQAWLQDAYSQSELVLQALKLAVELLVPKGTFVTKVFRSQDYNSLLWVFGQFFHKVEATKPQASRNTSAEIFVVCLGFKAQEKIDPRLLDPKFIFKEVDRPSQALNVLAGGEHKLPSLGYEEGRTMLFKRCSVVEFVRSGDCVHMLGEYNQLVFDASDAACVSYLQHAATTSEIKLCCQDLRVLGKKDLRVALCCVWLSGGVLMMMCASNC